jgi:exopolyphosphatase/guanosine-5'-triphosphate,3'-diphosphate pyrophosphatase
MEPLHGLGVSERLLLEVACRAPEIGMYIRVGGHHRHAAYLISASPLLGLTSEEKAVLAYTVRYQRKAFPCEEHQEFMKLREADQRSVCFLSSFLRLAIALNKDRSDRVCGVHVVLDNENITLHLEGDGDLLLERWASLQVEDYIHYVFGLKLEISLDI